MCVCVYIYSLRTVFPPLCNANFILHQVSIYTWVCFWALYFVPLVYGSFSAPVSQCLHFYNFRILLVSDRASPQCCSPLKLARQFLTCCSSTQIWRSSLSFSLKNCVEILIEIALIHRSIWGITTSNRIYKGKGLNKICILCNKKSAGGGPGDCAAARWYNQEPRLRHFPVFVSVVRLRQLALTLTIQEAGAAPGTMSSDNYVSGEEERETSFHMLFF